MSAGAIPVVLSDGWALPLEEVIDWGQISVRVEEARWPHVVEVVREVLRQGRAPAMRAGVLDVYQRFLSNHSQMLEGLFTVLDQRQRGETVPPPLP